jgi:hypothetical protein
MNLQARSIVMRMCAVSVLAWAAGACGGDTPPPSGGGNAGGGTPAAGSGDHGAGVVTALGEQTVAGMTVRASRDGQGALGKDSPIDVWVNGGLGGLAAVRFWIGTEDAKGSVKAKAEDENGKWHTHADVPVPLPAGSRLWVELETTAGAKHVAGFDLKN